MSGLDFDDIHGDLAPALAEMSRLLRIVSFTPEPAERGATPFGPVPAGEGTTNEVIA